MSTRRKGDDFNWFAPDPNSPDVSLTIDPETGQVVNQNDISANNSIDVDGKGKGWLASLWNKWTGAGTTGQQDALNEFESAEAQKQRDWSSSEAAANRRFQAEQAQLDYDRQVEFYEKYQSIGAQMRQYKENGLNPSLLAGGVEVGSSAPSASMPSGSTPAGSAATATSPMSSPAGLAGFFGQILNMLKLRSEIDLTKSQTDKNIAETENTEKQTSWLDAINSANIQDTQSLISKRSAEVQSIMQGIKESISRIDVNNNTIAVGNARIALLGSEKVLTDTKNIVEGLNAHKMSLLMPYVQANAEAEIALKSAKTEEARATAEKQRYEANVKMLEGMVEADLISKGYYDSIVNKASWEAQISERNYHWKPINDICSNVGKICVGVGSVIGAVKGTGALPYHHGSASPYVGSDDFTSLSWD